MIVKPSSDQDLSYVVGMKRIEDSRDHLQAERSASQVAALDGDSTQAASLREGWVTLPVTVPSDFGMRYGCPPSTRCIAQLRKGRLVNLPIPILGTAGLVSIESAELQLLGNAIRDGEGDPVVCYRASLGTKTLEQQKSRLYLPHSPDSGAGPGELRISLNDVKSELSSGNPVVTISADTLCSSNDPGWHRFESASVTYKLAAAEPPPVAQRALEQWIPQGISAQFMVTGGSLQYQRVITEPAFIVTADYRSAVGVDTHVGFAHLFAFSGIYGGVSREARALFLPLQLQVGILAGYQQGIVQTASSAFSSTPQFESVGELSIGAVLSLSSGVPLGRSTTLTYGASAIGTSGRAGGSGYSAHVGITVAAQSH